jgi:hypothetical protein
MRYQHNKTPIPPVALHSLREDIFRDENPREESSVCREEYQKLSF